MRDPIFAKVAYRLKKQRIDVNTVDKMRVDVRKAVAAAERRHSPASFAHKSRGLQLREQWTSRLRLIGSLMMLCNPTRESRRNGPRIGFEATDVVVYFGRYAGISIVPCEDLCGLACV
ncbi:unnamed protein product [Symbiodinium necroappetens]|uniref:Uncharacterized protein n=1 Tax=Symbiodinium necroappetens TaxID=1628268 RepID=A0A812V6T4_9DINO|nr:unnamed protein product [Symbiodinium necroappetens]